MAKLRTFGELTAKFFAKHVGLWQPDETQAQRLLRLKDEGALKEEVFQVFEHLRKDGNKAAHGEEYNAEDARTLLHLAWQLGWWLHYTLRREDIPQVGPEFIDPANLVAIEAADRAQEEKMAMDAQQALEKEFDRTPQQNKPDKEAIRFAQKTAPWIGLNEEQTRELIDEQLRQAGWEADSKQLTYAAGARPEKGRNQAIAEWPCEGRWEADYVLFAGPTPVAVVEAKRQNKNVSGCIPQAERYSRTVAKVEGLEAADSSWGEFRVPFVFATNGRSYFRQHAQESGIWFRDVRHSSNIPRALAGWPTPEHLLHTLHNDPRAAQAKLEEMPMEFEFSLRDYQKDAIRAVEAAMGEEKRRILLAMATGTGKTQTCVALIYRLLKAGRARRVLFLVDRNALGEQAAGAFKYTKMEGLQNFADIYNVAELGDKNLPPETSVHVATVQSMVRRHKEGTLLPIDAYDVVVVDEAHRGYSLDREMNEAEQTFRDEADYQSKYSRVVDHFDATCVAMTATPALHTAELFGEPVYTYSYRQAVVEGHLIDHEPPTLIKTQLSQDGIHFDPGDEIEVFDGQTGEIATHLLPDELHFKIDSFNRKVLNENFNREVARFLAKELEPDSDQKTLVFAASDLHADMVVQLLKEELLEFWGEVDNDAVAKITGNVDDPLGMIRKFKNERLPNIAVTVDLLTTGVDVPAICNLVFLRRIKSRVLYEQMLGRATRQCPEVGKEFFKVYDAVGIYEALQNVTDMKPVVQDVKISFSRLAEEVQANEGDARAEALRQFVAKWQRRRGQLTDEEQQRFQAASGGLDAEGFAEWLLAQPPQQVADWLAQHGKLIELLDTRRQRPENVVLSTHEDAFLGTEIGYGEGCTRPEDYLEAFGRFIQGLQAEGSPVLVKALERPAELSRKDLQDLKIVLGDSGFTSAKLESAWRQQNNKGTKAGLIGHVRAAALGQQARPLARRVEDALDKMLSARSWDRRQEKLLKAVAEQTNATELVDEAALDEPNSVLRIEHGGKGRFDKVFEGEFLDVLRAFNAAIWED